MYMYISSIRIVGERGWPRKRTPPSRLVSLDFTSKLFFDSCIWNFRCASNRIPSFLREERERERIATSVRACARVCVCVWGKTKSDERKRERRDFSRPDRSDFSGRNETDVIRHIGRHDLTEGSRSETKRAMIGERSSLESNESTSSVINRRVHLRGV